MQGSNMTVFSVSRVDLIRTLNIKDSEAGTEEFGRLFHSSDMQHGQGVKPEPVRPHPRVLIERFESCRDVDWDADGFHGQ